eukprot:scaffold5036_cov117-Isochrysis_galbana.AAC.4
MSLASPHLVAFSRGLRTRLTGYRLALARPRTAEPRSTARMCAQACREKGPVVVVGMKRRGDI